MKHKPEKDKKEEIDYEIQLLRKKIESMMTSVVWRTWLCIRERRISMFSISSARREYEVFIKKTVKRIADHRANGRVASAFAAQEIDYKPHHWIATANKNFHTHARTPILGALSLFDIALKIEDYETAAGLSEFISCFWNTVPEGQKPVALSKMCAFLVATGEYDRCKKLLIENIDIAFQDDESFSLLSTLGKESFSEKFLALPKSGTPNNFYIFSKLREGANASEILLALGSRISTFHGNPQNYLQIANCYRALENIRAYEDYVGRFCAVYDVVSPRIQQFDNDNILSNIEFSIPEHEVHGPLITVIMSARNAENTIRYAVASILQQSYRNIELLLCDDGSDDGTLQLMHGFATVDGRVKIFNREKSLGTYANRNWLISQSQGEFITFQDADDIAIPTRIHDQLKELLNSSYQAVVGRWVRITPDGYFVFFRDNYALRLCVVSLMAHRNLFDEMPLYREARFGADTEFYERLRLRYGDSKIKTITRPLIFGLWSANSLTRQSGTEALEDGYRSQQRRAYSSKAAQQRYWGDEIIDDAAVNAAIKSAN